MLIVSYFTKNGTYPEQAKRLLESCNRFGLRSCIQEVGDQGTWAKTCNYRPTFVLEKLLLMREAILCLDCDCEIMAPPTLLYGASCDFAAYNFSADLDEDARLYGPYDPNSLKISGGVQYYAYTAPAIELLLRLIQAVNNNPNTTETDPLHDWVYNTFRIPIKTLWLPKSYNRLSDRWQNIQPVIEHHYKAGACRTEAKQ